MHSVCVIMSSYNGEKYLSDQINSILDQKDVNIKIYVRDDGSTDNTVKILNSYKDKIDLIVNEGINLGAKRSFIKAIEEAPIADYYALSDQDDVWDDDKLITAINRLEILDENTPLLYCSSLRSVDKEMNLLQKSILHNDRQYTSLKGEIIPEAGCTMVFNNTLRNELIQYTPTIYPMHDYWILLVCLALDGDVIYDPVPHMSYRQHENNAVGGKKRLFATINRRVKFYKKMGKNYHSKMYSELLFYANQMSEDNIDTCEILGKMRKTTKDKWNIINNEELWRGSRRWKIETFILLWTNYY